MKKCDLESYVRNTHIQEECFIWGKTTKQNHTHKVWGFVCLVWREGEFFMPAGKKEKEHKHKTPPH